MKIKNRTSFFSIIIIIVSVFWINFNHKLWENPKNVIKWDVINYYQYLPATFYYNDLSLEFIDNNPTLLEWKFWPHKSPINKYTGKMSIGLSFMYLPFYFIAYFHALITNQNTDGFSSPFAFWLIFSSLFYIIISFFVLRKILLKFFEDKIVALTILLLFFATNLLYYTTLESPMSHAYSFTLFTLFIYFTIKWNDRINLKNSFILGLLFGLISLIRPSNSIIIIFFTFYGITAWSGFVNKLKLFLKNWNYLLIIALFSFIVWIPQMIYWKFTTGSLLYFSYQNEGFFFNNPQIIKGLFGYRKGWLLYTPLMFFAIINIILLLKKNKEFFLPIFIFTFSNIYIIFSWWCWWYGGTYGQRVFIESYSIYSIPIALGINYGLKTYKFTKIITYLLIAFLITHQIFQTIQFNYKSIHYDSMTKRAYWDSFLRIRPSEDFNFLLESPDYENAIIDNKFDTKPHIILKIPISIKSLNNKYLSVNHENGILFFQDSIRLDSVNHFLLLFLSNGKIAFKSKNSKYFTANIEKDNEVFCRFEKLYPWETFNHERVDKSFFAIKAINKKYLSINPLNGRIYANKDSLNHNEKFIINKE